MKVTNERERRVAVFWSAKFQEALDSLNNSIREGIYETLPFINKLHQDALVSIINDLDAEIELYDKVQQEKEIR